MLKGELQRENELISYERAFKMPENDMYMTGIGQAVHELLSFEVGSGNRQRAIFLLQKSSESHNFQTLEVRYFLSHVRYELLT